jgi:hypothetical protein
VPIRTPAPIKEFLPVKEDLLRLVYVSAATSTIDRHEIEAILGPSAAHNATQCITGLLCAGGGHYLQALEGPAAPVMALYLRIVADPRHRDATLLSIGMVDERLFARWAMAHITAPASAAAQEIVLAERELQRRGDRAAAILQRFLAALKDGPTPDAPGLQARRVRAGTAAEPRTAT